MAPTSMPIRRDSQRMPNACPRFLIALDSMILPAACCVGVGEETDSTLEPGEKSEALGGEPGMPRSISSHVAGSEAVPRNRIPS